LLKIVGLQVKMLSLLNHPNVARLLGASILDPSKFVILTEFAPGGSLYSVLHVQKRTLDSPTQVFLMTSLARGMHYLHNLPRPIIHRDLNSHNVLINAAGQCVVIDFGEARFSTAQDGLRHHESFTLQPGVCCPAGNSIFLLTRPVF
jgi:serine/threonine-protein kinase TNNI3K